MLNVVLELNLFEPLVSIAPKTRLRTLYLTVGMTSNDDRLRPSRNQSRDVLTDDSLPEHSPSCKLYNIVNNFKVDISS